MKQKCHNYLTMDPTASEKLILSEICRLLICFVNFEKEFIHYVIELSAKLSNNVCGHNSKYMHRYVSAWFMIKLIVIFENRISIHHHVKWLKYIHLKISRNSFVQVVLWEKIKTYQLVDTKKIAKCCPCSGSTFKVSPFTVVTSKVKCRYCQQYRGITGRSSVIPR